MRILIVSQYFWPESFRINELVASLVDLGNQVDVLTGKPNYPQGEIFSGYRAGGTNTESWSGATVFRVPLFPRGSQSRARLAINYLSFVLAGAFFGPFLLRGRPYDAIFVYGTSPILQAIPAIILSWIKRCRLIIWVQDLWPESLSATGHIKSPVILGLTRLIVRWIYGRANLLLVQSRAFREPVADLAPGKPIIYYPNSVDPAFALPPDPELVEPEIPALDGGFSVVFAGNIGAGQAVEVIVGAAEKLRHIPEIRFVIIGEGSRSEWMLHEAAQRGLNNLHLPGWLPTSSMPGIMQKADALLVTLTNRPIFALTVPNKVQAYMAAGRPIIACLNGEGARLVKEAEAGIPVAAEDVDGLAKAVLTLYNMPAARRTEMGEKGRNYFLQHFDHEYLTAELTRILEKQVDR